MTRETKPIPEIAKSAFDLFAADCQRKANELGRQTVEVMGLGPEWTVDLQTFNVVRTMPDIRPEQEAA